MQVGRNNTGVVQLSNELAKPLGEASTQLALLFALRYRRATVREMA